MGVEFEMYALPSFSSCWDEDVLKFLYWLILAFDLKFEMSFIRGTQRQFSEKYLFGRRFEI